MNELIVDIDLDIIWDALQGYRENFIPENDPDYDEQWSDICTQMAWIEELLKQERVKL